MIFLFILYRGVELVRQICGEKQNSVHRAIIGDHLGVSFDTKVY